MDIDFLRRLHKKVNVVLVIAKADALTTNELKKLKANILNDLDTHKIELYQFPDCDSGVYCLRPLFLMHYENANYFYGF